MTSRKEKDRMKILAVNGRPRKYRNTAKRLQKALHGAKTDSYR